MSKKTRPQPKKWLKILVVKTLGYPNVQKDGFRYRTFSGEIEVESDADGSIIVHTDLFNQLVDSLLSDLPDDKNAVSTSVNMIRLS